MSYTKNITVYCDYCGRNCNGVSATVTKARKRAATEGWTHKKGSDYCSVCSGITVNCVMCGESLPNGVSDETGVEHSKRVSRFLIDSGGGQK